MLVWLLDPVCDDKADSVLEPVAKLEDVDAAVPDNVKAVVPEDAVPDGASAGVLAGVYAVVRADVPESVCAGVEASLGAPVTKGVSGGVGVVEGVSGGVPVAVPVRDGMRTSVLPMLRVEEISAGFICVTMEYELRKPVALRLSTRGLELSALGTERAASSAATRSSAASRCIAEASCSAVPGSTGITIRMVAAVSSDADKRRGRS